MATRDPNWTDEDFDDPSSGFLSSSPKRVDGKNTPDLEHSTPIPPLTEADSPIQVPVVPTIHPPSSRAKRDHSSVRKTVLLLLLFFITAVGLGVYFFVSPSGNGDESASAIKLDATNSVVRSSNSSQSVADTTEVAEPSTVASTISEAEAKAASVKPTIAISQRAVPSPKQAPRDLSETITAKDPTPSPEPSEEPKKNVIKEMPPQPPSKQPATRNTASSDQEWCIQVFASTNADDADEWEARLRSKNIIDSRIEIVDRQGQTWYRVRFGKFKSREDAEQLAMNLGFSNAWINRIR